MNADGRYVVRLAADTARQPPVTPLAWPLWAPPCLSLHMHCQWPELGSIAVIITSHGISFTTMSTLQSRVWAHALLHQLQI